MTATIAFIAPYAGLAQQAEDVIRAGDYDAKVWLGDLHEGVRAARAAMNDGAKVLISRGGTANLIRREIGRTLTIDVIEVETSVYSLVSYLNHCKTPDAKVAIVGFGQFIAMGKAVCASLGIEHKPFEVTSENAFGDIAPTIAAWNASVVIGDVVSSRHLEGHRGINFHLIESSPESVRDAFEKATLLFMSLQRQLAYTRKLSTVLEQSHQGVIILDNFGAVEDINRRGLSLLGLQEDKPIGRPLTELVAGEDLAAALAAPSESRNVVVSHNNDQLFCSCTPLDETLSGSQGMMIAIQPVRRIQDMENGIRRRLHNRGFFAKHTFADIVHKSPAMRKTIAVAAEYAKSEANIVVTGETGTGKELFAQSIHNASSRSDGMFVAVNCATLPPSLAESELFGYSPGAFTGASKSGKIGYFELAHNGTIFLDEITEMDPYLQPRLLRVLQEREIVRVGDDKVIPVNVRVIAASNRNLNDEVADGNIRLDLFFRLSVLNLRLPPLRERKGDAAHLFRHYLSSRSETRARPARLPGKAFMEKLDAYAWPGNVRQLENVVEKYRILADADAIGDALESLLDFGPETSPTRTEENPATLDQTIRRSVKLALAHENGNIVRAARRLGISRNTLKRWIGKE